MTEDSSSSGAALSRPSASELGSGTTKRCSKFNCDRAARTSFNMCALHSRGVANGSARLDAAAGGDAQSASRNTGGALASATAAAAGVAAQTASEGDRPPAPNAVPEVLTASGEPAPAPSAASSSEKGGSDSGDVDARAVSALADLAVGVAAEVLWFDGKWYDCVVHTMSSETKKGTLFFPSSSKGKYKTFSQELDFQDLIEKGYLKPDRVFGELEVLARCAVARATVGAGLMS